MTRKSILTDAQVTRAIRLRDEGHSWPEIGLMVRANECTIRDAVTGRTRGFAHLRAKRARPEPRRVWRAEVGFLDLIATDDTGDVFALSGGTQVSRAALMAHAEEHGVPVTFRQEIR